MSGISPADPTVAAPAPALPIKQTKREIRAAERQLHGKVFGVPRRKLLGRSQRLIELTLAHQHVDQCQAGTHVASLYEIGFL